MAQFLTLDEVQAMTAKPGARTAPQSYSLEEVERMHDQAARDFIVKRETTDLASGVRRGLRDVFDTGAEGLAALWDKGVNAVSGVDPREYEQLKARNDAARQEATQGLPTTPGSMLGYVGGNALATAPVLGAASAGLAATGVPALRALGSAIQSSGSSLGGQTFGRAADLGLRSAGGATAGYVTAGGADPAAANTGAVIGAVLPPAMLAMQKGFQLGAKAVRQIRTPAEVRDAVSLARMAGVNVDDAAEMAGFQAALRQEGPQIIPGSRSVPEIAQAPAVSQLQRTVQARSADANAAFGARNAEREAARLATLERMGTAGNRSEVADDVGNAIFDYAIPAHQSAKGRVSAAFQAVDPQGQSRVLLPIDEMQAAKDKFLGPGTFGSGGSAQQAINEARRIGTQPLPAVRPVTGAVSRQPQTLEQAIRKAGGISPNSAGGMNQEIAEFTRKQAGTTGLVSRKGLTVDQMAERMAERGFIKSADPAELLDALRAGRRGEAVYAADVADDAFRARYESAMGEAPQAGAQAKPVTFDELQSLRSSIGEQWRAATRQGNAREAAALDAQRRAIDKQLEMLEGGWGQPEEFFPSQMLDQYKKARGLHAAKEARFKTGPQAAIFRRGADGAPMAAPGSMPGRFFNGGAAQATNAQAFRRLVQDDPQMMASLRDYVVSDAAATRTGAGGNFTAAGFNRWLDKHSGGLGVLLNDQQRAWLRAIAEDLRRAHLAESLGRSSGSDTVQKAASMMDLGLVDSPATRFLANRVPFGSAALDFATAGARAGRAERLGGLLLDAPRTAGLLGQYTERQALPLSGGLLGDVTTPILLRSNPVLWSAGGGQ